MEDLEIKFETQLGTISSDPFTRIREWVELAVGDATDAVVTEDNIKNVKDTLTEYRKLKTALEKERKRIKKEWAKPYEDWELQYKASVSKLDETIEDIAGKVKTIEDEQEEKRISTVDAEILRDADDIRKGLAEIATSNPSLKAIIFKANYYNKFASKIKSTEEWRTNLLAISRDLDVINASADSEQLMVAYLNSGNLAMAMQIVEDNKKRIAVIKQQKAAQEEREVIKATTPMADIVDITPQTFTFTLPNEDVVDPTEKIPVKSTRMFVGELYKIKALYKFAMSIGLNVYEPKKGN